MLIIFENIVLCSIFLLQITQASMCSINRATLLMLYNCTVGLLIVLLNYLLSEDISLLFFNSDCHCITRNSFSLVLFFLSVRDLKKLHKFIYRTFSSSCVFDRTFLNVSCSCVYYSLLTCQNIMLCILAGVQTLFIKHNKQTAGLQH